MRLLLSLACLGCLLALLLWFLPERWRGARIRPDGADTAGAGSPPVALAGAPAPDAGDTEEARREIQEATVSPAAGFMSLEEAFPFELAVRVLDEERLARAGARVLLAPRSGELRQWATTDQDGLARVELRGRSRTLELAFAAELQGMWSGLWSLELATGEALELELGLLATRWTAPRPESGEAAAREVSRAALMGTPAALGAVRGLREDARDEGFSEERTAVLECLRANSVISFEDEALSFHFAPGGARIGTEPFASWSASAFVSRRAGSGARSQGPPPAFVQGVVLDARGNPVPGAAVSARPPGATVSARARSDEAGRFLLGPLAAGTFEVRARDAAGASATTRVELGHGDTLRWSPYLEPVSRFGGRLIDARGAALSGWTVELVCSRPPVLWSEGTRSAADGTFAFERFPGGPFTLLVRRDGPAALPVRVSREAWPGDLGDLVIAEEEPASLRVAVLDPDGAPLEDAELRLWQLASGRGAWLELAPAEERFLASGLAPGSYGLEIASRYGWQELGPFELAAGEELDLGEVRFAPPAVLDLRGAHGIELTLWRSLRDVFVRRWVGANDAVFALPPGDYRLTARAGEGVLDLYLGSGESVALSLRRAAGEVFFRDGTAPVHVDSFDRVDAVETYAGTCLHCHD